MTHWLSGRSPKSRPDFKLQLIQLFFALPFYFRNYQFFAKMFFIAHSTTSTTSDLTWFSIFIVIYLCSINTTFAYCLLLMPWFSVVTYSDLKGIYTYCLYTTIVHTTIDNTAQFESRASSRKWTEWSINCMPPLLFPKRSGFCDQSR